VVTLLSTSHSTHDPPATHLAKVSLQHVHFLILGMRHDVNFLEVHINDQPGRQLFAKGNVGFGAFRFDRFLLLGVPEEMLLVLGGFAVGGGGGERRHGYVMKGGAAVRPP